MKSFVVLCAVCAVSSCSRDLTVPSAPPPKIAPIISSFEPHAAFSGDALVVYGDRFDPAGNQLIFAGGATALAERELDGGDVLLDGGLVFLVPDNLSSTGPLVLSNTYGRSSVSADDFAPLGVGHPNLGTPVSSLRFRHNPVGLIDREENVLMGSSLFDLVVTDGKAFRQVPGRPIAMRAGPRNDHGMLAVRTPTGGVLLEVSAADGEIILQSAQTEVREHFILPPNDSATIARTIGIDVRGRTWLSEWRITQDTLVPTRVQIGVTDVLGAAALGKYVMIIARNANIPNAPVALHSIDGAALSEIWTPRDDSQCTVLDAECSAPTGAVALVPMSVGAPLITLALGSGDLLLIDSGTGDAHSMTLTSYARIDALAAGATPNKLVVTKAVDGAVFQYDLSTEELDWSVQLRGEPTVVDVAPSIDEVAVGNRTDNAVDIVRLSTGTWVGRISFELGMGSADETKGGIVAPYSYDPARYAPGETFDDRMDLLLRNVGLVVSVGASNLEVYGHLVLDRSASEVLRLAVTHDLKTLVIHRRKIGVLETVNGVRSERIVTTSDIAPPLDVCVLEGGDVILSYASSVQRLRWAGPANARVLEAAEPLALPPVTSWRASVPNGNSLLVVWAYSGGIAAALYGADEVKRDGSPTRGFTLDTGLSGFIGAVSLREGPMLFFSRASDGNPVAYSYAQLVAGTAPAGSAIDNARITGVSPDGHFITWVDDEAEEPSVRLLQAYEGSDVTGYSSYRVPGKPAGPEFDPSGQWLFIPIPRNDELVVVQ